ncbi:hypothetical protein ACLOJK_004391 [Asimina triloba]
MFPRRLLSSYEVECEEAKSNNPLHASESFKNPSRSLCLKKYPMLRSAHRQSRGQILYSRQYS